jgi:uncharacterized protein
MKICKGKKTLIGRAETAGTFFSRLTGLLGRDDIPDNYALYFSDCNSIHTFFMKIEIDVIMISGDGSVTALFERLGPWKTAYCGPAKGTIEMKDGTIKRLGIKYGDRLSFLL